MLGHFPHNRLGEVPGLSGRADQDRRFHVADDIEQLVAGAGEAVFLAAGFVERKLDLVRVLDRAAVIEQAVSVGEDLVLQHLLFVVALFPHGGSHQPSDADARRTRTRIDDSLLGNLAARDADRAQDARQGHGGRSLNVVVEAGQPLAISIQYREGQVLVEVLPLQQARGKTRFTPSTNASMNSS